MKNYRTFWEHMKQRSSQFKQRSKRIVTTTLLASILLPPWNAAEAEPPAFVDCNCTGYSALAVSAPYEDYPNGVAQIMYRMSMYDLQANTFTPTFLHQPAPAFINKYEPRFAVDEAGFLVVFSW